MSFNISRVLCFICVCLVTPIYSWDISLTSGSDITFLHANGTIEGGIPYHSLHNIRLHAIAFDPVRHRLFVSNIDSKGDNATRLFSISLSADNQVTDLLRGSQNDSIQGIAYDPILDTLYFTQSFKKRVMKLDLKQINSKPTVLFQFKNEIPQGIAIDVCRRMLYWTNSNFSCATIERYSLDDKIHTVMIKDDLHIPTSITVDQSLKKIFWADDYIGIEYRVESANFDGSERKALITGRYHQPSGIVVSGDEIYWTDWVTEKVWSLPKNKLSKRPTEIYSAGNSHPMGLSTKNQEFAASEECRAVVEAMINYNESTTEIYNVYEHYAAEMKICLNDGELIRSKNVCKCKVGFTGERCEIEECHNFCVNGKCYVSSNGYPQCECPVGFTGMRCEQNVCNDFCLNGGHCQLDTENNINEPICQCEGGYLGRRCEQRIDHDLLCRVYCNQIKDFEVFMKQDKFNVCRCGLLDPCVEKSNYNSTKNQYELKLPAAAMMKDDTGMLSARLNDPIVVVLMIACGLLFLTVTCLLFTVCWLRRRPRIKKRFVVNKNVTPLTCRPLPTETEQCEITIENCCNMNVCDTPCFEPPQIRSFRTSKTDEKKTLLSSMENNEELY